MVGNRRNAGELADAEFGGDLAGRRGADEHGIAVVTD
jgi:hypothetical protein